jgi:hypothetical protein
MKYDVYVTFTAKAESEDDAEQIINFFLTTAMELVNDQSNDNSVEFPEWDLQYGNTEERE